MSHPSRSRARQVGHARPTRVASCARLLLAAGFVSLAAPRLGAQTLDDGVMVSPHQLRTTVMFGREQWDQYWEGTLKRSNDNIGTLTTRTMSWMGAYGLSKNVSLVATLPYVWTKSSEGVLSSMQGRQDLTVAVKYRAVQTKFANGVTARVLAVGGVGAPTSNYTPDFLPLSIGMHDRQAFVRGGLYLINHRGFFFDGWGGHVWRSNVTLDRPAYYTNGQLIESNEVDMPNVANYTASVGYNKGAWCIPVGIDGQRTLGGGDIRRQDMPFVSNRMNLTEAHAEVMYYLPMLPSIQLGVGAAHVLAGRNVGQSTKLSFGVTHVVHL